MTRSDARALFREIKREIGGLSLGERFLCCASPILAVWTAVANRLRLFQQPALLRVEHRTGRPRRKISVVRLQGGFHANFLRALKEDVTENTKALWAHFFPSRARPEDAFPTEAVTRFSPMSSGGEPR